MRIPTLAVAVSAAAAIGWSGVGAATAAPPSCEELEGVVNAEQTCQIQLTDPGYSLSIDYPIDYPDVMPVVDYVRQTRDGFLNVAETPDSRTMPYELETTSTEYGSALPPRGTQSVVFETYQGVGGASPTIFYESFNWDQTLRRPITIGNLFREGTQPFEIILPIVQSELEKQSGEPVSIPTDVGLDPATYENFALTNDSLIFFFGEGELLAGAFGAQQVAVPRGPLASMIA